MGPGQYSNIDPYKGGMPKHSFGTRSETSIPTLAKSGSSQMLLNVPKHLQRDNAPTPGPGHHQPMAKDKLRILKSRHVMQQAQSSHNKIEQLKKKGVDKSEVYY